ncbi:MAG: hypothetical protein ACAI25_17265 [Planctomycetota bacterium]
MTESSRGFDLATALRIACRSAVIAGWCGVVPTFAVILVTLGNFPQSARDHAAFVLFLTIFVAGQQILQTRLEGRREIRWYTALAGCFASWVLLNLAFVLARLNSVYALTTFETSSAGAGLERAGAGLSFLVEQGRTGEPTRISRVGRDGVYFARLPALMLPPLVAWIVNRLTKETITPWVRPPLVVATFVALFFGQAAIADRYPPFMYKCPGWNGYLDVLGQCTLACLIGAFSLPLLLIGADRLGEGIARIVRARREGGASTSSVSGDAR